MRIDSPLMTNAVITGSFSGSFTGTGNFVGLEADSVEFANVLNKPTLVSGSEQIDITGTTGYTSFSSSIASDIAGISTDFADITNKPTLVSGSSQIDITATTGYTSFSSSIASDIASNDGRLDTLEGKTLFSGSSQIDITSTTGYTSFSSSIASDIAGISTDFADITNKPTLVSGSAQIDITATTGYTSFSSSLAGDIATNTTKVGYTDSLVKTKLNTENVVSGSTQILNLVSIDEDNMSSNSDTKVPTQQSVKTYVDTEISALVSGSPETLDTLNELAAALGDDPNFATTVSTTIGGKVSQSLEVSSGDGLTGGGNLTTNRTLAVDGTVLRTTGFNVVSGSSQVNADTITNFDSNVKDKLNLDGVISGSSQVSFTNISDKPTLVSGSAQIVLQSADKTGFTGATSITTLGTVTAGNVTTILPSGIISGSSQVNADTITNFDSNVKDKLNIEGVVSGSSQINITSTTGYTSFSSSIASDITFNDGRIDTLEGKTLISSSTQFNDLNTPFTGSFTGSFQGDGSNLTGIETDPFPYTGSAIISGSGQISGSLGLSYGVFNPSVIGWSAGGALITARYGLAGAGTQNAGLAFGGMVTPAFALSSCTEEYDGTSWSAGGALSTARRNIGGAGEQNAGLAFGGLGGPSCTEEYNGTSWSAGGALITARLGLAGAGTQNAALAFGGGPPGHVSCTEEYDGTSWSGGGALITARSYLAGAGTQNAGLAFGGSPTVSCTEEYDGTSWSAGGALITARENLAGAGTQNAGLAFGGFASPAARSCTEEYNGTSWSAGGALITARFDLAGAGTQDAGLAFGGSSPSTVGCTEEYSETPGFTTYTKTFDYSDSTGEVSATGSFTGSFQGDGSNLTGIETDPFPYTGSAVITGSLNVIGDLLQNGAAIETDPFPYTGSAVITGSLNVIGDLLQNGAAIETDPFPYTGSAEITGSLTVLGTVTTTCIIETSALRCKSNIEPLHSSLEKVKQLKPVSFDWKNSGKSDIGFIAEEVKEVLPNLIHYNIDGEVEGMNYSKITSLLVSSIQELEYRVDELTNQIQKLKNN